MTKPGCVCLFCWHRFFECVFCCLLGRFFSVNVSLCLCVFCLLVVLVKWSVLAKWLARKTPLRTSLQVRRLSPQKSGRGAFMTLVYLVVYCFIACLSFVPRPYTVYFILLWHDISCLFWKCRWTPINQPTSNIFFYLISWLLCCYVAFSVKLQCTSLLGNTQKYWRLNFPSDTSKSLSVWVINRHKLLVMHRNKMTPSPMKFKEKFPITLLDIIKCEHVAV